MKINREALEKEIPLVWYVARENDADICICKNTDKVNIDGDGICSYASHADKYRESFGVGEIERFLFVTDNKNVARKTAYLFAGDVKNDYIKAGDDGSEVYFNKSEIDGVLMAEIDMKSFREKNRSFPLFSYDLDGAVFSGADSEEVLKDSLNAILSCELPFEAVIINEKLLGTATARKLLFDYGFTQLDLRGLAVSLSEAESLMAAMLDVFEGDVSEEADDGEIILRMAREITPEEIDKLMKLRGDDFREEDLIRLMEIAGSDGEEQFIRQDWSFDDSDVPLLDKILGEEDEA